MNSDPDRSTASRLRIPQQRPRQDALEDQLRDLHALAARCGMYDAADWLWKAALKPRRIEKVVQ